MNKIVSNLQIFVLFIALVFLIGIGLGSSLLASQDSPLSVCKDGRLNCDAWQTGAVYCDASGIQVLYSSETNVQQGQLALEVSTAQINRIGIPITTNALLANNDVDYTLHRLTDGQVQFTAPALEAGKLYEFRFSFPDCRESNSQLTIGDESTTREIGIPSGTLIPSSTPVVPATLQPPTLTPTNGPSPTPSETFTPTMTMTPTETFTPTMTMTPTETFTSTSTMTPTETSTP